MAFLQFPLSLHDCRLRALVDQDAASTCLFTNDRSGQVLAILVETNEYPLDWEYHNPAPVSSLDQEAA